MAKKLKPTYNPDGPTLDLEFQDSDAQEQSGPVTVLGMTFADDDERRAYFREQLRAKLPELRHIEGFPIGSDDDIVNLSDPPYYTACPNPWLNDFIAEWEQEKLQLEAEGKRLPNIEVTEPYAADVSEGKNNPVYTVHTYHTKVPHPAIMRYILNYTHPGDIILDGFAGTGMTGLAAQSCDSQESSISQRISQEWSVLYKSRPLWGSRHAICGDLSPYASNISFFYNSPLSINSFSSEVQRILTELKDECGWLYNVKDSNGETIGRINFVVWSDIFQCPNCGQEYVFWDASVDNKNKCMRDKFPCPHCQAEQTKKTATPATETYYDDRLKKTLTRIKSVPVIIVYKDMQNHTAQRVPTKQDLELIDKIDRYSCDYFFPTEELPNGYNTEQPKRSRHIFYVHQFFTRRNLICLSSLFDKIQKSPLSHKLRFLFTAILQRSTVMNRVHVNNYFNGGGGWNGGFLKGTLYIPNAPTETSVIEQISDKLSAITNAASLLPHNLDNLQFVGSATNIKIKDNSIDYIFVDPPFGANINYSELNSLIEPWLRVITNNEVEAIENKSQNKDAEFYHITMYRCFAEYFRVLKPGHWMTVEFSNTSAAVWNSLQTALQFAGFVVVNVAALDKKQGSFKAVTTTTAVKQDLIISCFKPSEKLLAKFKNDTPEGNVWDFVDELLSRLPIHFEQGNKTTSVIERSPKILYDRLISFYVQHGFQVPLNAQEFQTGLRERYTERDGMFFLPVQAVLYDEMRKHTDGFQPSLFFVDSEQGGIAWLNNELATPQTYQDLQPKWMQAINGVRKGDILPELMQILEENFIREADGHWRRPNLQDDVDLAALRMKSLLKEFKVYVEVANKPKGKIKEARVEALRAGFKQAYKDKDFATIVRVGDRIPSNLLQEDEQLLQFYQIASSRV